MAVLEDDDPRMPRMPRVRSSLINMGTYPVGCNPGYKLDELCTEPPAHAQYLKMAM